MEQIWGRFTRLVASQGIDALFGTRGRGEAQALRRAEELIREANERDRREKRQKSSGGSEKAQTSHPNVPYTKDRQEWENACRVLGVSPEASLTQIAEAYRRGIVQHHPDMNGMKGETALREATRRTQELNGAFEIIRRFSGK